MEVILDREYLQSKVDLLKGITKHKSLMPICRSLLFDLPGNTMSATNLEVSAVTSFKTDGEDAKVVIHAGTLSEILENLKDQEVKFTRNGDETMLKIEHGRTEIGLALADPKDFPEIQVLNDTEAFSLEGKDILRGIRKVLYAVSDDEDRYVLTGMFMQVKGGQFRMCGTDGFRLAMLRKNIDGDTPDSPQIVIPGKNVKILRDMIEHNDTVGVIINEEKVQFMTARATIIFRTLSGAYPDYESAVSKTGDQNVMIIKRVHLLDCLKRMVPLSGKKDSLRLSRMGPSGLTVRIDSDKGYAQETVDCEFNNKTRFQMEFNLEYLYDAVEHIEADQLVVRYPRTYGAVVMDSDDYLCLVMPLRENFTPIEEEASKGNNDKTGGKNE